MLLDMFGRRWRRYISSINMSGRLLIYWSMLFFFFFILLLLIGAPLSWWWWRRQIFLLLFSKYWLYILLAECRRRRRWNISFGFLRKLLWFWFRLWLIECCNSRWVFRLFLVWFNISWHLLGVLGVGLLIFANWFFSFLLSLVHDRQTDDWVGMISILCKFVCIMNQIFNILI